MRQTLHLVTEANDKKNGLAGNSVGPVRDGRQIPKRAIGPPDKPAAAPAQSIGTNEGHEGAAIGPIVLERHGTRQVSCPDHTPVPLQMPALLRGVQHRHRSQKVVTKLVTQILARESERDGRLKIAGL